MELTKAVIMLLLALMLSISRLSLKWTKQYAKRLTTKHSSKQREEIEHHINDMGPYDFQKLVEELLKAMGYFVPFNAKPGRDGGIDLGAYKDALGITPPRIKVQIKHREQKLTAKEVRELEGLLLKDGRF